MPRASTVRVDGAKELRAALKRAGNDAGDLKDANRAAAELVADEARTIVPELTGRLAASIRANRAQASAVVNAGGARLPYAAVIHFGWPAHNIEPTPFLYDALDERRAQVVEVYQRSIDRIVASI